MNTFTKVLLVILGIIGTVLITGVIFIRIFIFPQPLSKEATEKDFIKNWDNIAIVTHYLINSKYKDIYINNTYESGVMFVGLEKGEVSIEDSRVVEATDILLKKKGYGIIVKNGSTLHFQRSTRFRNFSSGIAYSLNGTEPQLEFLTRLEPLSKKNWYYYEEDFNEFKKRNKD